jgi:ethanolamine transporter EutH
MRLLKNIAVSTLILIIIFFIVGVVIALPVWFIKEHTTTGIWRFVSVMTYMCLAVGIIIGVIDTLDKS